LNPIEHIWWYHKNTYFESKDDSNGKKDRGQLFFFFKKILESKHVENAIKTLYETLPIRIADVIEHKGWWSRFGVDFR
jgi:hypothetical protein